MTDSSTCKVFASRKGATLLSDEEAEGVATAGTSVLPDFDAISFCGDVVADGVLSEAVSFFEAVSFAFSSGLGSVLVGLVLMEAEAGAFSSDTCAAFCVAA